MFHLHLVSLREARLNPFSGLFMHHSFHIYVHIYFIETPFHMYIIDKILITVYPKILSKRDW